MKVSRTTYLLLAALLLVSTVSVLARCGLHDSRGEPDVVHARVGIDDSLFSEEDTEPAFTNDQMLGSQLCTQSQFETEAYAYWTDILEEKPRYHCKQWEYAYILKALAERHMLTPGMKGLGFGVGQEPLPSVFAKFGVEVLATDLEFERANELGWVASNQHLSSIEVLNKRGIVSAEEFQRLVRVRNVDMNDIPADLRDFDFTWSTCSLGHLGSLEKGLIFIENSLETIKPGGVAVHTTEFNLSSDDDTFETPGTVVYRKKDIKSLVRRLTAQGHEVHVNYNFGKGDLDRHIDYPPYTSDKHIKIRLGSYVVTSLGLIIRKNPNAS